MGVCYEERAGKKNGRSVTSVLLFLIPCNAYAGTENEQGQGTEAYLEELYGLTDFSEADQVLEGKTALSFTEIVKLLLSSGSFPETGKLLLEEVKMQIFGGMEQKPEAVSGGGDISGTLLGHQELYRSLRGSVCGKSVLCDGL